MEREGYFSEEAYRDAARLRVALHAFFRAAYENARAEGLTLNQWQLLLALRVHPSYPDVTVKQVAEALQASAASTSQLIDRAVRNGYVVRARSPADRRKVVLGLTADGQRVLDTVMAANREGLRHLIADRADQSTRAALPASIR